MTKHVMHSTVLGTGSVQSVLAIYTILGGSNKKKGRITIRGEKHRNEGK